MESRLLSKKLIKEFLNKGWGLKKLFEKAARNWHDGKTKRQP